MRKGLNETHMKRYRVFIQVGPYVAEVGPAGGAPIYAKNDMDAYMKACLELGVFHTVICVMEINENDRKGD